MKYWKEITIVGILIAAIVIYRHNGHSNNIVPKVENKPITFTEAFNEAYLNHGEGYIFTWNNNEYIVKFKEEE